MSEAPLELDKDMSPGGQPPNLKLASNPEILNDPYGPFFNTESTYPNFDFHIDAPRLVGGIVESTPQTRLRYCLARLSEKCGGEFTVLAGAERRNDQLKAAKNWLDKPTKEARLLGQKSRRAVLDFDEAANTLLDKMWNQNHPVAQLLFLVETEAVGEKQLTTSQLNTLKTDLLAVTNLNELEEVYTDQIEHKIAQRVGSSLCHIFGYILPVHGF